jgi:hypothetical protein
LECGEPVTRNIILALVPHQVHPARRVATGVDVGGTVVDGKALREKTPPKLLLPSRTVGGASIG